MKKYLISLDFNNCYMIIEKSYYHINITKIPYCTFEFLTEDKSSNYSNKNEDCSTTKLKSKQKKILTEGILHNNDFKNLKKHKKITEIYVWTD